MTVYVVEVTAIYENPGVTPTQQRRNQRDSDMAAAQAVSNRYQPGGASPADEYLETTPDRYGFGWRCRQFITVRSTAENGGNAIRTQLQARSVRNGSKVQVFPDNRDTGGTSTGAVLYQWSVPAQPEDTTTT